LLQELEKRYGFYRAVSYNEVSTALNLSGEQKSQLASARLDGRAADVLTAEQQKQWKELTGEPFAGRLQTAASPFGPATSRFTTGPEMAELTWLRTEGVQRELKLTAEQTRQLASVEESRGTAARDYLQTPRESGRPRWPRPTQAKDALAKVLQPEQMKRLRQIAARGNNNALANSTSCGRDGASATQSDASQAEDGRPGEGLPRSHASGGAQWRSGREDRGETTTSQKEARRALLAA
jgi:hypothetical protein